jgi:hypothetical protein
MAGPFLLMKPVVSIFRSYYLFRCYFCRSCHSYRFCRYRTGRYYLYRSGCYDRCGRTHS